MVSDRAPVQVTSTSVSASAAGSSLSRTAWPPTAAASRSARSSVRLAQLTWAPAAAAVRTASPAIAPAPTTSTRRPARSPRSSASRAYAALTSDRPAPPISVSVCTRLPTRSACWNKLLRTVPTVPWFWQVVKACFTWPRIWLSPTTSESRPEATAKVWATAPSSKKTAHRLCSSGIGRPAMSASAVVASSSAPWKRETEA